MENDRGEPSDGDQRAAGGAGIGVFAILVGIGAVIVASQTQLTLTKQLTGSFYLKDAYRLALQYCGIALVVLGVLLTVLGSIANTDKGAVDTLRVVTTGLALTVLAGGVLVVAAYIHTKDLQAQNSTTTDTTTTDTATTDTTTTDTTTTTLQLADPNGGTVACLNFTCHQGSQEVDHPSVGAACGEGTRQWTDAGTDPNSGAGLYQCR